MVPGHHMGQLAGGSSVEVPVSEGNKTVLKKLGITPISAQLIVKLEKDFNNYSLGPDNVANSYFNWRIGNTSEKKAPEQYPYAEYIVGPRDILVITVWEHPELTIPAGEFRSADTAGTVVGEDGNIFFPYVGVLRASGKTVEEIRSQLTRKLAVYIQRPQVDVRVTSYRSQRVYVVGEVLRPGIQTVKDIPLTVLEAINGAGGLGLEANARNITLTRNGKTYGINLLALYEGGDFRQNVILQGGDVLNVPDRQFDKVFVLGETNIVNSFAAGTNSTQRSRSVLMNKGRMTLIEAISEGGGINQETADAARIFVFRGGAVTGKPEIFHLDAKSPDALLLADRFPLQPHDVIFVDRAEGIRWNQILNQVQPTINLLNSMHGGVTKVQPF
ncbi:MAG: polysaccharide biosynthesis/export family protein [Methylomonas sp.]|jgi:polysaccharide export outer membrane protein